MKLNFVRVINKLVKLLGNINVQNTTYFISKHESFSLSHNFICTLYKEETKQNTSKAKRTRTYRRQQNKGLLPVITHPRNLGTYIPMNHLTRSFLQI